MRGRPFEKGKSGNPGGRPKIVAELRDLARRHAPGAVEELARLATKARSEAVRVSAIRELLDRGYGKPMQPLEGSLDCAPRSSEQLPLVQFIFSDDGTHTSVDQA
jgi:hypothetical protein